MLDSINGSEKGKRVFVLDLGFSWGKWIYNGRHGRVPSAYQRHGDSLLIGEQALILTASSCLRTTKDLVHYYPVFVERISAIAGVCGDDHTLAVGLPHEFWAQEKVKAEAGNSNNAITELTRNLTSGPFSQVMVLPQGLGGIKSFLREHPEVRSGNVLGIDIGFNTTIFMLYSLDLKKVIYANTLYKKGVHHMTSQLLLPAINSLTPGKTYSPVELSLAVEKQTVQFGLDVFDISEHIARSANTYMNDLLREVVSELQGHLGQTISFNTVVFFGGGARLLKQPPPGRVNVFLAEKPEFYNARGFSYIASEKM